MLHAEDEQLIQEALAGTTVLANERVLNEKYPHRRRLASGFECQAERWFGSRWAREEVVRVEMGARRGLRNDDAPSWIPALK